MIRTIVLACLSLLSVSVNAQTDPVDELVEVLAQIGSMQGGFQQKQYDQNNELVAQSHGSFRLMRPGYFSWEIESPDSQLIVTDPEYIWHHDRDLETVTRRAIDESEQMSPLQVLGGDEALLRRSFEVRIPTENTYTLLPAGIRPGFTSLSVAFDNADFKSLEIVDNLNQKIEITFDNIDSSSTLTADDFAFTPPAGADFFDYTQQ